MARHKRRLTEVEEATIAAFVLPDRQERERLLLARGDSDWAHDPPLEPDVMWQLPRQWRSDHLLEELRRRGAPETCTGIYGQLTGETMPLSDAITVVFAAQYGDLVSLIPGRLAYYDGEWKNARYLLSR